jgi:uncharacterized protein (TIGR00661 family)
MVIIFYGIAGEGYGHAIRSKIVIDELQKNHKVCAFAGGKAYAYLSQSYPTHKISSLRFVHRKNSVSIVRTAILNILRSPMMISNLISLIVRIKKEKPHVMVSDFEPISIYAAMLCGVPCISVNYPFLNNTYLRAYKIIPNLKTKMDYALTLLINWLICPKKNAEIVTTFFHEDTRGKEKVSKPVLRESILTARTTVGDYVLVYQTSKTNVKLVKSLYEVNEKFVFYGFDKNEKIKNVNFKRFDSKEFAKDLAGAKAVIANGGFSLMSECAYLHKPLLAIPVHNRYEQVLNGMYLKKLGFGTAIKIATPELIETFLDAIPSYRKKLQMQKSWNNKAFFELLEKEIKKLTRP